MEAIELGGATPKVNAGDRLHGTMTTMVTMAAMVKITAAEPWVEQQAPINVTSTMGFQVR